eukprot:1856992-Pyramimonas_sp.AAC.1
MTLIHICQSHLSLTSVHIRGIVAYQPKRRLCKSRTLPPTVASFTVLQNTREHRVCVRSRHEHT